MNYNKSNYWKILKLELTVYKRIIHDPIVSRLNRNMSNGDCCCILCSCVAAFAQEMHNVYCSIDFFLLKSKFHSVVSQSIQPQPMNYTIRLLLI